MTDQTSASRDTWRDDLMMRIGEMQGQLVAQTRLTQQVGDDLRDGNERQAQHAQMVEGRLVQITSTAQSMDQRMRKVEASAKSFDDLRSRAAGGMVVFSMLLSTVTWISPLHAWVSDKFYRLWHLLGFA